MLLLVVLKRLITLLPPPLPPSSFSHRTLPLHTLNPLDGCETGPGGTFDVRAMMITVALSPVSAVKGRQGSVLA